jgi:peptide/nickel transport system substrate-binding protein
MTTLNRRAFVRRLATAAAALGAVPLLQACAPAAPASPTAAPAAKPTEAPKPTVAAAATTAPAAKPTEPPKPAAAPTTAPAVKPATPAGQPVAGGTLRTTLGAEPTTLDPHKLGTLFDRDVADAMFDALIDDDTLDGIKGQLAESWDSPDARVWTFKLRSGVKFHDGSPLTAESVKFSFDRLQDPNTGITGQIRPTAAQVEAVESVDASTVRITLKTASAAFPVDAANIKIIPKDFDTAQPVGTGPFKFGEWVRNQRVRVTRNPDYFVPGQPYLDELVFLPTPDENQKIVLLQTGQVDFTDTIPLPRVKEVEAGGKIIVYPIPVGVAPSSYFMPLRTDRAPLDNAKVRQAMNLAIDRQALLDVTFGVGTVKSNVVPPKHWAFNPNAMSFDTRDVARAKQLMAEGGHPNGFSIQFKFITSRAEYTPMAQLFQANLADIGVKLDLQPKELGVWVDEVLNKHEFELGMTGIIPDYDPHAIMVRYHSKDSQDGQAMNWQNAEFEQLLAQGKVTVNQEDRKRIYFRAQELAQEGSAGFVVNERPILYGASPQVQGFRPDIRQHTHFATVWLAR